MWGEVSMPSKALAPSGWLEFIGGKIIATDTNTYFLGSQGFELSYFVFHKDLVASAHCGRKDAHLIQNHCPVYLELQGLIRNAFVSKLARPHTPSRS